MTRILFFAAKVVLIYLVFFFAFKKISFLTPGYYRLLASGGNAIVDLLESPPSMTINARRDILYAFPSGESRPITIEQGYEMNLILVLALFLATPNVKAFRRLTMTGAAAFALILVELLLLVAVLKISLHFLLSSPGTLSAHSLQRMTGLVMEFQDILPVILWIVMGFRYFKGWLPVPHGIKGVGRNDPCPCGSGKKYKKCCGSTP